MRRFINNEKILENQKKLRYNTGNRKIVDK